MKKKKITIICYIHHVQPYNEYQDKNLYSPFQYTFLLFRSNWTIGLKYENMKKWIKKISHIEFLNANPTARMCHFLICVCLINPTV